MEQKVFHCIIYWSQKDKLSENINKFIGQEVTPGGYTVKQISSSAVSQLQPSGSLEQCIVVLVLAEKP